MATPRITSSKTKKTTIPPKPNAGKQSSSKKMAQLDQFVAGGAVEESSGSLASSTEEIVSSTLSEANQKGKMKRLTLDISEDLHKAIKMQSVTLGIPMVDMLRKLLESNYGKL